MIRNIIFDIGNVLVDFCWRQHIEGCGYNGRTADRLGAAMMQSSAWHELDRGVWTEKEVLDAFIRNEPELEEEIHRVFENLGTIVREYPGTASWLTSLKEAGYGLFYLSNFPAKVEREAGEQLSFLKYMDGGILSYRVREVKPEPAIYRLLLEQYGLKPEECVFLDDSPENIRTAETLGIKGIVVKNQEQAREELKRLLEEADR